MATTTTKLGLRKPDTSDLVNVLTDLNANFDILDVNPGTFVGIAAARAALSGSALWVGRHAIETDTGLEYVYNGTAWVEWNAWGAWTQYVPVWTPGAPVIGNGSLVGRYRTRGKSVELFIHMKAGTTTTFGSAGWSFSIPAGMITPNVAGQNQILNCIATNDLVATYLAVGIIPFNSSAIGVYPYAGVAGGAVSTMGPATPFAWGNLDALAIQGVIEVA